MILKTVLLFLMITAACSQAANLPSSTISLSARDVLWAVDCASAPVSLPFCRQGAGATLATYCASGGSYATCGGGGGGTVDGSGATNKVAYWLDVDTLTYDTLFHFDPTGNNIGLGTAVFGTGLTQGIALTHDTVNWPSTNIADTVQLYARDQDTGGLAAGLFVKGEQGGIVSLGDRVLIGNGGIILSNGVAIGGLQLETVGPSLQMSNTISVAHGTTGAGVATSVYLDMRPIVNTEGGIQIRGLTETNLGVILSSVTSTDPVSTKSTTSDGAMKFEFGKKFISTPEGMAAGVNLVSFSDAFSGGLGTRWILDNDGDTWQTGRESSLGIDLRGSTSGTFSITPNAVTTSYTITMPAAQGAASTTLINNGSGVLTWGAGGGGGDALVANPLSQFAATTSAQLAGVLSNETGTTLAVFSDAPTFTGIPLFSGGLKTTGTPVNGIEIASGSGTTKALLVSATTPSLFTGDVRIGLDASIGVLTVYSTSTTVPAPIYSVDQPFAAKTTIIGVYGEASPRDNAAGTSNQAWGLYGRSHQNGSGILGTMGGVYSEAQHDGPGNVSVMAGMMVGPNTCGGGTCALVSGIYIQSQTVGSATYQLYSEGTALSYFAGPMTITSKLNVAGTAPTISGSCGTAPSIVGSSVAGKLTTGTVAPTSCTLTFATAWTNAPACSVTNETTANLARAVSTTTTVVLSGTFVASDVLSYICIGRN